MRNIFSLLFASLGLVACKAQDAAFTSLDANAYEQAIANADVVRLDVRTAEEYAEGHIADAINIDVRKADFKDLANATLPKARTIAVNCRSGKRSKKAAEILTSCGYKVIELDGGFIEWTSAKKPTTTEAVDLFVTPSGTCVYLYCVKHGSVKMKVGTKWVYVDPVSTALPPVTDFSAMPKADAILITHEHHDHLEAAAIQQLVKSGTVLVANPNSAEIIEKDNYLAGASGVDVRVLKNGESTTLFDVLSLDAVPAYNNSDDKKMFHPQGRDNGYVVTFEGLRIYLAGDTEDIPEMEALKDVDVAFLPCNLPYTMTPEQLSRAAKMFNPRVLFPYHYGNTEIQQAVTLLKGSSIDVRIRNYQ